METAPATDSLLGQVLDGRFEVLELLGQGGMGNVYRARQRPLDRIVALKVLNPHYDATRDPGFERRFFLEASLTAKLRHPNTITIHDYGRTSDGIFYIAMEYLDGETLLQVLNREGRLPWLRTLTICSQVARSLREAHKAGIVHRDLKPANIMLLQDGSFGDVVKVLDFGLVKPFRPAAGAGERATPIPDVDLTQSGVLLGSPLYMAPEQTKGIADPRTDVYALGVLMFQCLAGRTPFSSPDSVEVIIKHLRERPPDLAKLAPEVPVEIVALVARCLAKEPEARFQSMDELLDALRATGTVPIVSGIFPAPSGGAGAALQLPSPPGLRRVATATGASGSSHPAAVTETQSAQTEPAGPPLWHRLGRVVGGFAAATAVGAVLTLGVARLVAPGVGAGPSSLGEPPRAPPLADAGASATAGAAPAPTRAVTPDAATVAAPDPSPGTAAAAQLTFVVTSEPPGATVTSHGTVVGRTPLELPATRLDPGPLRLELGFSLEGYEPARAIASGETGTVQVHQVLQRRAALKVPP